MISPFRSRSDYIAQFLNLIVRRLHWENCQLVVGLSVYYYYCTEIVYDPDDIFVKLALKEYIIIMISLYKRYATCDFGYHQSQGRFV